MSPLSPPLLVGKRIVIVEDEGITLMQMERMFTRAGIVVVGLAGTGEEAIEVILREKPDLVTMDLSLKGMNGIEATRRVMEIFPTSIVILSAYHMGDYQQQAEKAGACGYITKPFTAGSLLPALEACFEKSQKKP